MRVNGKTADLVVESKPQRDAPRRSSLAYQAAWGQFGAVKNQEWAVVIVNVIVIGGLKLKRQLYAKC